MRKVAVASPPATNCQELGLFLVSDGPASAAPCETLAEPITRCAACGEPLYAGFPLRTVPDGAMHVGCHMLWLRGVQTV